MDVVTFGEAMVRLTPPGFQRLEAARNLEVHVGGGELNVAVGVARLGLHTRWISRLTDNPLGRLIANRAREHGVDLSHVAWTDANRAGLYFAELGAAPRASSVLYDRAASAMAVIDGATIDWKAAFGDARWFHISGITPALSDSAAAATSRALETAARAGLTVSYDLNYRSRLWTAEQARAVQLPLLEHAHVLITSADVARLVFGEDLADTEALNGEEPDAADDLQIARALQERFALRAVAITTRDTSRAWLNNCSGFVVAGDEVHQGPAFEVEVVDPIGSGDAFSAGLIYGYLTHDNWNHAVRYGTALAALKQTTPGDFSLASLKEVDAVLAAVNSGKSVPMRVQR